MSRCCSRRACVIPEWPARLAGSRRRRRRRGGVRPDPPRAGARRARARIDQRARARILPRYARGRAHRVGHHARRDGDRDHDVPDGPGHGHRRDAALAGLAIGPDETAGELSARLAPLGADVMLETLDRLDTLTPVPQRHDAATLAPRLKKGGRVLDWRGPRARSRIRFAAATPGRAPPRMTRAPAAPRCIWRDARRGAPPPGAPGTLVDTWRPACPPSPRATARSCPARSSRRAGARWRGTSSCAARRPRAPASASSHAAEGPASAGPRPGRARDEASALRVEQDAPSPTWRWSRARGGPPRPARRRARHRDRLRHAALAALSRLGARAPTPAPAGHARSRGCARSCA